MPVEIEPDVLVSEPGPWHATCATVVLNEGAHEIELHFGKRSIRVVADNAVIIASKEHRPGACRTTR